MILEGSMRKYIFIIILSFFPVFSFASDLYQKQVQQIVNAAAELVHTEKVNWWSNNNIDENHGYTYLVDSLTSNGGIFNEASIDEDTGVISLYVSDGEKISPMLADTHIELTPATWNGETFRYDRFEEKSPHRGEIHRYYCKIQLPADFSSKAHVEHFLKFIKESSVTVKSDENKELKNILATYCAKESAYDLSMNNSGKKAWHQG